MRRIGIMGGTFNPIHNGHLAIADKAREQFALEKVLFMPSGIPYMKDQREVLPIQTRCEMTALAIKDMPGFELSEMEASDAALGKNTYTCDTLQKLKAADPEADYYFILGADSLYAMEDWKNPALIFQNCTVLAAVRTTVTLSVKDGTSESGMRESGKQTQEQQPHFSEQVRYLQEKIPCFCEVIRICRYGHILHTDPGDGESREIPARTCAGGGCCIYLAESSL